AMEERLAFTATTAAEVAATLAGWLDGPGGERVGAVLRGQVRRNREAMAALAADDDLAAAVEAWLAKGKYATLLGFWTTRLAVDGARVWGPGGGPVGGRVRPRRIGLPTYPFALEQFWPRAASGFRSTEPVPTAPELPAPGSCAPDLLLAPRWDAAALPATAA